MNYIKYHLIMLWGVMRAFARHYVRKLANRTIKRK